MNEQQILGYEKEIQQLKQINNESKSEIDHLNINYNNLQTQNTQQKNEYEAKIENLEDQLAKLQRDYDELLRKTKRVTEDQQTQTKIYSFSTQTQTSLPQTTSSCQTQDSEQRCMKTQTEVFTVTSKTQTETQEFYNKGVQTIEMEEFRLFIETQRQNQLMADEIEQLKLKITELTNEIETINEVKQKTVQENKIVSHDLTQKTTQLDDTVQIQKKLKMSFEQAMKQNLSQKKRIQELEEQLRNFDFDQAQLVKELKIEIQKLKDELSHEQQKKSQLKLKYEEVSRQL